MGKNKEIKKCRRLFIVTFEERFAVEGNLLGKRIKIHPSDKYVLFIIFPTLVQKNKFIELGIPGLIEKYGVDIDNYGKVNNYNSIDDIKSADAWISAVAVECWGDNPNNFPSFQEIQESGKKIIHALQVINPDAMRYSSDTISNQLCDISAIVDLLVGEKPQIGVRYNPLIVFAGNCLCFHDIKRSIKNVKKPLSAPYELLDNARVNLARQDTRATILNCASSIEVLLKKKIKDYFDVTVNSVRVKNYLLKKTDGFSKLVEMCKICSIDLNNISQIKESIFDIRNRVIHCGYVPSQQEAYIAYESTRKTLSLLKVQIFE